MKALRELFWWSACYNFHITASYIAGSCNHMADWDSRLDEPVNLCHIDFHLYCPTFLTPEHLLFHMSLRTFLFLSCQGMGMEVAIS